MPAPLNGIIQIITLNPELQPTTIECKISYQGRSAHNLPSFSAMLARNNARPLCQYGVLTLNNVPQIECIANPEYKTMFFVHPFLPFTFKLIRLQPSELNIPLGSFITCGVLRRAKCTSSTHRVRSTCAHAPHAQFIFVRSTV